MADSQRSNSLSFGLPRLSVNGNRIVEAESLARVCLRGVNRSGLECSSPDSAGSIVNAGITESDFDEMITAWGANIVRVPFNQSWALGGGDYDPAPYLFALDTVIRLAAQRGAYTLLDLQWLDAVNSRGRTPDGKPNFVAPLPNLESIALWRSLAARYRDEPAVLYDVFNEPHDLLRGDTHGLYGIRPDGTLFTLRKRRVTMDVWHSWAMHLIGAIRSEHPAAVIFVSGTDWGYNLRGHPVPGRNGLVYSTHIYRDKGKDWDRAFGDLAGEYPVFAAELGGLDADTDWGESLLSYLAVRNIGWAAWSWADHPHLIHPAPPFEPTGFGKLIRSHLRQNVTKAVS